MPKRKPPVTGTNVRIAVAELEFNEGGDTLWIHSPLGATVLRLKFNHSITSQLCLPCPASHVSVSHADILIDQSLSICLGRDAKW